MESTEHLKLYKRRWPFLLGLALFHMFAGISSTSYGQISDFYVQFFKATYSQVDWITNARNISAVFITFPFAWLVFKGKIGLRNMVLIISVSATIGILLVTLSLVHRSLFILLVIGQFLWGFSQFVNVAVPATFSVLWFPESQVGTALSVIIFGVFFGEGAGYMFPVFIQSPLNHTHAKFNSSALESGQRLLRDMYGSFFAISAVVTVLFAIFITDKPPTPPTVAQVLKKTDQTLTRTFKDFLRETRMLFTNASYAMVCLMFGIIYQISILETMMMSEVMKDVKFVANVSSDKMSGYIMCMFSVGGLPGLFLAGAVINRWKKYKLLAFLANTFTFLCTVAIIVCVYFENTPGIFASNAFFGFGVAFSCVVMLEMVTQLTYPVDETLVNSWLTGFQMTIALLLGVFGRIVFNTWMGLGLLSFQSVCVFVAVVMSCLVSSKNRRLEVEAKYDADGTVFTPLINNCPERLVD